MGFDQNSDKPILQPQKRTTKVNFWLAGLVVVFLLIGLGYYLWTAAHPAETQRHVQQNVEGK
jgi:hypothetical protein